MKGNRLVGARQVEIDIVEHSNIGETEVRLSLEDFNYIIMRANRNSNNTFRTDGWVFHSTPAISISNYEE